MKTCGVQEYSPFPGPGGAEVGLSEEGARREGGEEKGACRSRCSSRPVLGGKLLSSDISSPTDNPQLWRDANSTQRPLAQCINVGGLPSACVQDSKNVMQSQSEALFRF